MEKPYAVVKFISNEEEESYSEIPISWLSSCRNYCYWPNKRSARKYMLRGAKPDDTWKKYNISVQQFCDTLEIARKKALDSDYTSTEEQGKGKRRKKQKKIRMNWSSDDACDDSDEATPPPTPQGVFSTTNNLDNIPIVICTQTTPVSSNGLEIPEFVGQRSLNEEGLAESYISTPTLSSETESAIQKILLYVKSIDNRLKKLENFKPPDSSSYEEIEKFLPLSQVDSLKFFDEELASNKDFANQFRGYLKTIGGRNLKDTLCRVLKRTISNSLGIQCSWLGYRNNTRICDRLFIKIVKEVMMNTYPVSEHDIDTAVSEWLRLSKLRLSREKK